MARGHGRVRRGACPTPRAGLSTANPRPVRHPGWSASALLALLVSSGISAALHPDPALAAGIQQVQEVGGSETAPSSSLTTDISTEPGDLIVVAATLRGAGGFASTAVGDSSGNTYTKIRTETTGANVTGMFYSAGTSAVTSVTVQASAAATIAVSVEEFAGISPNYPLDVAVGDAGKGDAPRSGTSAATTQGSELVVAGIGWDGQTSSSGQTPGYAVNPPHRSASSDLPDAVQSAYRVIAAAGPQRYAAELGRPEFWGDILATFTAGVAPLATDDGPVPALAATMSSTPAPWTAVVSAAASTDAGAAITGYTFDFGDGTVVGPQETAVARHTYATLADFTVGVTITDALGRSATAYGLVAPGAASALGSLGLQLSSSSAPATVTVTAPPVAASSPITAYIWDFGDGSDTQGSPGPSDHHTYEHGGTYALTLTVFDQSGEAAAASATVELAGTPGVIAATGRESQLTGRSYCSAPAVSLSAWGEQEYVTLNGGGTALQSPSMQDLVDIGGVYACGPLPELPTSVTSATAYGFQCSELAARYYMVEQRTSAIPSGNGHGIAHNIASQSDLALVPAPAEASGAAPPVAVASDNLDWVTSSSNPDEILPKVGDIISMGASQASLDANPDDQAELSLGHAGIVLDVTDPSVQRQTDGSIIIAQQDAGSGPDPGLGQILVSWQSYGLSDGAYDEFNWVSMGYSPSDTGLVPPAPSGPSGAAPTGDVAPPTAPTPPLPVVRHLSQLSQR